MSFSNEPQWPPRSPLAALKSTPGGRDRLRQLAEKRPPSPSTRQSPTKQLDARRSPTKQFGAYNSFDGAMDVDGDDDEDEETLQLRLAEIQAKLRLKKLQKQRAEGGAPQAAAAPPLMRSSTTPNLRRANSTAATRNAEDDIAGLREERLGRNRSQASVHVPVSPIKRAPPPEVNRSPSRVLLGIDKGLKGSDVSLRPAPVLRKPQSDLMNDVRRAGNYLHRSGSSLASIDPFMAAPSAVPTQPRPATSFSERMAKVRDEEVAQREKAERLKHVRNKAFDIDQKEMETLKRASAVPLPSVTGGSFDQGSSFSSQSGQGLVSRSKSSGHLRTLSKTNAAAAAAAALPAPSAPSSSQPGLPPFSRPESAASTPSSTGGASEFDSFSSTHLLKRIIPHTTLTRTFKGKKTFKIPDLLRDITAQNNFQLPECDEDIVVFAILANKSEPKTQKNGATPGAKFMILTLCDLKWEIDLYLFGSGFGRYWKLTPGHVLAILNPAIMKPFKSDTGRFSLVINSDDDTILEIGSARDLSYCKSIKKDGSQCDAWVDKRHTEFCEFHINEALRKTKSGRMEVNTMDFGKGRSGAEPWQTKSKDVTGYQDRAARKRKEDLEKKGGKHYDWKSGGNIYMHKGQAHFDNDVAEHIDKKERTRKRFAAEEKEKELARQLGNMGGGLGAEYMAKKGNGNERPPPLERDLFWNPPPPPDARKLGLLDGKASEVSLGPVKRKRTGTFSSTSGTGSARGWGGDLSKDLSRMREGQRLEPVKKKTRFVTSKGIREAGRESFGGPEAAAMQKMVTLDDDDDDDDLDIIR